MKKTVKNVKFDALKLFCELSKKIEASNTIMLHEFMPDFYPKVKRQKDDDANDFASFRRKKAQQEAMLKNSEIKAVKADIEEFARYFEISEIGAILLVAAYTKEVERESTFDIEHIVSFLDIKAIDFMPLKNDFDKLVEDGLFLRVSASPRGRQYKVDGSLSMAITCGAPYVKPQKKVMDRYEFCNIVASYIQDRSNDTISTWMLFENVEQLENQNATMAFVQSVKKLAEDVEERTLFYECCNDFVENGGNMETSIDTTLSDIYDSVRRRMKIASVLQMKKHTLILADVVELTDASFLSDMSLTLTDKGKNLFFEEDVALYQKRKNDKKLISPESIKEKQLFYSADFGKRIDSLTQSLMNDNFVKLQARLEDESMPKGVSVIFYGAPGTGKTETAMQIARQTGRKVYHVDISASKSCWFGESEKLIKRIFTGYREMCNNEDMKPILLFNEADALFSKRKDVGSSNVAQTENAIQNIILEELEKLDGILVATTNLADNLDPAFERRFVFKLKFDKPTLEAKRSIWKSKLPWLDDGECSKLAADYDFSGGEIDNIARKVVMDEVISGERPDFSFVVDACKNERFVVTQHAKVGF